MRPQVFKNCFLSALLFTLGGAASAVNATIVQFQTVMGDFEVNLYDEITPFTVANFLDYVEDGSYTNTVFHRSVDDFVIQGGGFVYEDSFPPEAIVKKDSIDNEPVLSNRRGTIAMAKIESNPHSATNQWFINLSNNSGNLDAQNGGFTVFGEVVGEKGMKVVDAIAELPRFNAGGAFSELPLRDYTSDDAKIGVVITDEHLVIVRNIVVTNAAVDTAADLDPPLNNSAEPDPDDTDGGDSGGGSLGLFNFLLLSFLAFSLSARARRR